MKPTSIVSYNHLGNNDGMNLSAPQTFRSKEISKSNVVDDMVASNSILFEPGEHPDHVVVIKVIISCPCIGVSLSYLVVTSYFKTALINSRELKIFQVATVRS